VLLGQAWMVRAEKSARKTCRVVYVNGRPPYRRPLQRDCSFVDVHAGSLASYIGRPFDTVQEDLSRRGVKVSAAKDLTNMSTEGVQQFYLNYRLGLFGAAKLDCYTLPDPCVYVASKKPVARGESQLLVAGFSDPSGK
jgi:hypothetical protein